VNARLVSVNDHHDDWWAGPEDIFRRAMAGRWPELPRSTRPHRELPRVRVCGLTGKGAGMASLLPTADDDPPRDIRASAPLTVGVEEEVLLVDPETGALIPVVEQALDRLADDPRFCGELPAGQLEIALPPAEHVGTLMHHLRRARRDLAAGLEGIARPAVAGVHPCAPAEAPLRASPRNDALDAEFGSLARRQQVCALQVHVAVGDVDRTIAIHDALRSYLPELAALGANAPMFEGRDTGMASVRPVLCRLLPRQGIPPVLGGADGFAEELGWGMRSGALPSETMWWWELRPHPRLGTLEVRVPDAQTTIGQATAITAVVHALVGTLSARLDRGESLPVHPAWRIEQNRWSACRDGIDGHLADLDTGVRTPTPPPWPSGATASSASRPTSSGRAARPRRCADAPRDRGLGPCRCGSPIGSSTIELGCRRRRTTRA
jgi:carboxylate-amine ligase